MTGAGSDLQAHQVVSVVSLRHSAPKLCRLGVRPYVWVSKTTHPSSAFECARRRSALCARPGSDSEHCSHASTYKPSKRRQDRHSSVTTIGLDTAPLHGDGGVIGLEHVPRGAPSCVSPVDRCHQSGCRVATLVLRLQHTNKASASIVPRVAADPSRRGA